MFGLYASAVAYVTTYRLEWWFTAPVPHPVTRVTPVTPPRERPAPSRPSISGAVTNIGGSVIEGDPSSGCFETRK